MAEEQVPVEEPTEGAVPKEARTWGMLCHLSALAGYIIPFGNVIGPLVFWLLKKEEFPFVEEQGKEALNFQITMAICGIVATVLIAVVIGLLLLPAVAIFNLVMIIMGSIKANKGESFRYPISIKFIK